MSSLSGLSIGIYEKALPSGVSWRERLTLAAQAGFDFVEMSLDPTPERLERLAWSKAQRNDLRRAIEETGVAVKTMCLSAHRNWPLGCGDAAVREQGLALLRQALDLAADVGIRIVQLAGYDTLPDETPGDASRERYLDALRQAVVWASERAVMMGLENQEVGYVDSPTTAVHIIEQVNSPYLQLYMDVGNLIVKGLDPLPEIAAARGHLVGIHVKDARLGVPRRVPFGEGSVPFGEAFRRLKAGGFAGPVMIEMWNDDRPDAVEVCAAARRWIEARFLEAGYKAAV
ncbi:MAG: L-ribulose-5-phosphate 3-epimerase [Chloroflexi bacterium]|nr:L-ribulose-5-phosphate 3-epimerase [Chloroflexota bacterium]